MSVRSCALRFFLLAVMWAALVRPADAQFRASIQGTVNDASGAAVPGVIVVVTNMETGVASETVTSEAGFYRVSGLAPGRYSVKASLTGFKEALAENVAVSAEEARGLDLTLETGNLQETVTVTAGAPVLRTENAEISGTFSSVEIKSLPQAGRDPYELARLAPGVFGLGARGADGNSVGVPNQAAPRGRGILPLLRGGARRCGGPGLLSQSSRHDDDRTERGAGGAPLRKPLHAHDREVVLRRLSRNLSVRRHAG